jgi:hypothetical protein
LPPPPSETAVLISGRCLEDELRGKTPKERSYLGAQFVAGTLRLIWPSVPMTARMVKAAPELIHRALGHPVQPPCPADMASYISRFGIERTERLLAQIKAVTINVNQVNQGGAS